MEQTEFVCTIGLADTELRTVLLDTLVPEVLARRREDRTFSVDVPISAEGSVRSFVAEESTCCPFFSFRIDRSAERLRLTVEAPPGGGAMLDVLAAAFDPRSFGEDSVQRAGTRG